MPQAPPFGIVGLGTIGGGLARQALDRGITVVGHDQNPPREDLRDAGLEFVDEPEGFRDRLSPPRRIFMYVPAGDIVDTVLDQLTDALEDGDVIVDGGNSYWGDSIRRQRRLSAEHDLHYVDMGTSGGSPGAEEGACFMAGGTDEAFDLVEPILDALSVEGGYVHCGPPGAGHFVKLVHNGIEFGMLQAIGEGMQLLDAFHKPLPIADILNTWSNGSVIRSWLVELMEQQYREQDGFDDVPSYVEDTGEVDWLVEDAMRMEVPAPVITHSVVQLMASRDETETWAKAVAMMRHGFGEHPFGRDAAIARYRRTSRVGPYPGDDEE